MVVANFRRCLWSLLPHVRPCHLRRVRIPAASCFQASLHVDLGSEGFKRKSEALKTPLSIPCGCRVKAAFQTTYFQGSTRNSQFENYKTRIFCELAARLGLIHLHLAGID